MNMTHRALSAAVASLVTLLALFGTAWIEAEGLTDEELKKR